MPHADLNDLGSLIRIIPKECTPSLTFQTKLFIHYYQIAHNKLYSSLKILHKHCLQFLLGLTIVPREIVKNAYVKFWGANKVYYGQLENSKYHLSFLPQLILADLTKTWHLGSSLFLFFLILYLSVLQPHNTKTIQERIYGYKQIIQMIH